MSDLSVVGGEGLAVPPQNALLSVFNKDGIQEFAGGLHEMGWNLYASGGTAKAISEAGLPVEDVATLVNGDAILDHRVVTLSREIHGGLLADPENRKHMDELAKELIPLLGLVRVDMYPLEDEIARPGATPESIRDLTDIGGPTMLRSAVKGERVVVSLAEQQQVVLDWLAAGKPDEKAFLRQLGARAEYEVGRYVMISAAHLGGDDVASFVGRLVAPTKYGENAPQAPAGLYADNRVNADPLGLDQFEHVQGMELSFVNETDIDSLVNTTTHIAAGFERNFGSVPAMAVGVKHGNACGAGVGETLPEAVKKMLEGDTRAIFGGVVMINGVIDEEVATILMTHAMEQGSGNRILDGVIGSGVTEEALAMLTRAKLRVVTNPALGNLTEESLDTSPRLRTVRGGALKQPNYTFVYDLDADYVEEFGEVNENQKQDMVLAWAIGSTSNSNTITLVKDGMLIGNGVGQQDRVGAGQLALSRTTTELPKVETVGDEVVIKISLDRNKLDGAVAYSDSFFPFPDGPQVLIDAGIKAILTSVNTDKHRAMLTKLAKDNKVGFLAGPDAKVRGFAKH